MITKYDNYLNEFKSEDIKLILNELQDYFTIGFEIEIEINPQILKSLKDVPPYESVSMYPSRQNRKMMEDFKHSFPFFYDKYSDRIAFHDDETLVYGLEIINGTSLLYKPIHVFPGEDPKPFQNVNDALTYISDFFMDYEDQNHWKFSHRTSIHVNIGTSNNAHINMVKGVMMISDQEKDGFVFKGMENRLVKYCSSIKQKLSSMFKDEQNYKLLNTTNVKDLESLLSSEISDIYDFYGGVKSKMAAAKLFGMIPKDKYMEFRYAGGENLNDRIMKHKIIYFCYLVYLMTSDCRNKEYVRKLFSFINKLR